VSESGLWCGDSFSNPHHNPGPPYSESDNMPTVTITGKCRECGREFTRDVEEIDEKASDPSGVMFKATRSVVFTCENPECQSLIVAQLPSRSQ
jgi:hypothetical protein